MQQFTRKENFLLANTLNCIPFLLQNQAVLIDLRNDCSVAGRIENVDGHMNINVTEVVFINRLGQQFPFEQFMVRERMVRQIHIPAHIDMAKEIQQWCEQGCIRKPLRRRDAANKGKRTFKEKRAQERHKEILQNIEKQKQQKQKDQLESLET